MGRGTGTFSPLIAIDRRSSRPLHRQIYDAFRAAIVRRSLGAGQQVPSTRSLAMELRISRIPVLNAYSQLLAEGYFETQIGAGTFVSSSLPDQVTDFMQPRLAPLAVRSRGRRIARLASLLPSYERSLWVRGQNAFSVSQPDLDAFPLKIWGNLVARRCRNPLTSSMQYGDPMGLRELREAIAVYLRTSRAVRCDSEQVMIVSGSQQALDLTARVLLETGNPVWVEEPPYWLARHVLLAAGCRLIPVPVDNDGLDVTAGIQKCTTARAAFVAPSHQYPLGVTMSASRRFQLLQWARRSSSWIVEDDYDSEYRYDSKPIASLQGLDEACRVIYIGTFSKVLFPSLRVGYVVVPSDLVDRFLTVRHTMDVSPSYLYQAVLADFITEGHFSRHLRKMRILYSERRQRLVECIRREISPSLEIIGADAGMYLCAFLGGDFDDRTISEQAARENLWLWPLSPSYAGKSTKNGFILGFGNTTTAEIPAAVRHLGALLDRASSR